MRSLSICRVTHALYPDVVGGSAIFCQELSIRQASIGHRVRLFTTRRNDQPQQQLVKRGYEITRLSRVWMPWDSMRMLNPVVPSLYGAVRRQDWDLVDAHSQLFWMTAMSVKAAVDAQVPVVTTVHGFLAMRDWIANLSQRLFLWSVGAWALRNSSRVICLTKSDAREVAGLGVSGRKISVPIAVDPEAFRPFGGKRNGIVWIGRLVPEKGLETLLRAVAALRGKTRTHVVIAGDGPLRNKLTSEAHALGISDIVTFRFKMDRSDVAKLLQESQVFVLPSVKEGLPMTLLEAMASGNTIVTSDLPPMREVIGDAGLYFAPGKSDELARVLLQALSDRDIQREKGRNAREIVKKRFSWGIVLPLLEELYEEVALS
jgi:glycosyltransferase involved in cell wall biosynthesis